MNLEAPCGGLIEEATEAHVEILMTMTAYARRMSVILTALALARNGVRL